MDLRRLKTFVAVAELGTVRKRRCTCALGSLHCRGKSAIFSKSSVCSLFDHVGRRLILTAQGEQLLVDCRRVLTDLNVVRERADVLRRGDSGALKVLAPPHTIESVLSGFLPRYTQSFPHVHVELTEALALSSPPCSNAVKLMSASDLTKVVRASTVASSHPADVLAVGATSLELGKAGVIDDRAACLLPALVAGPGIPSAGYSTQLAAWQKSIQNCAREPRIAHPACLGGGWARCGNRPIPSANRSLRSAHCPHNA